MGAPLTPPRGGGGTNAIFPPTHHLPLGGQSLAKLSTKIKLRCRILPDALNRADWIRIFLFSSHVDPLGEWGPEGRLGPGGGGTEASQHFSALEPGCGGGEAPPVPGSSSFVPLHHALCAMAKPGPGWVLLSFFCS